MSARPGVDRQPNYPNHTEKQLWEAVDAYFAQAGTDSEANRAIIRPQLQKLGSALVFAGFSWVAERLEKEGEEAHELSMRGVPNALLAFKVIDLIRDSMGKLKDVVEEESLVVPRSKDLEIAVSLSGSIGVNPDEDERALMALMIGNNFPPENETRGVVVSRMFLEELLESTTNSSCKLALSWAIYRMGNLKPWEDLLYSDLFVPKEQLKTVESILKKALPNLKKEDVKAYICKEFAIPGSTGLGAPIVQDGMGLSETVALDIASHGGVLSRWPNWVRKSK